MKVLIVLYFAAMAAMLLMIPVKIFTSVQTKCPGCSMKVLYSKRKKEFRCPHCGTDVINN